MREIKFRAWNERRKEYESVSDLYWFEEHCVHENGDQEWILEQYIGLKDKNGREIYEGDILDQTMFPSDDRCPWWVVFEDGAFRKAIREWPDGLPRPPISASDLALLLDEVIGNIQENGDLMK